jgi:hypothetical protein
MVVQVQVEVKLQELLALSLPELEYQDKVMTEATSLQVYITVDQSVVAEAQVLQHQAAATSEE